MQNYSLYEMFGLVKLGVWQGAQVEGLGFVGCALECDSDESNSDLFLGTYLSYDIIIINNKRTKNADINLVVGVYQPYGGQGFNMYSLKVNVDSEQELKDKLNVLIHGEPRKIGLFDHIYTKSPFHHERRYGANYTNMRGGSLSSTRRGR